MVPAQPPLPMARSFPFQLAGSQSSTLMSESEDGLSVMATRQKAGRPLKVRPCWPPRPPGMVKSPAGTLCAESIFAFGNTTDANLSQDVPAAMAIPGIRTSTVEIAMRIVFMDVLPIFRIVDD